MYFFSDKKLARDLHNGVVTEKQQMLYLLLCTIPIVFFLSYTFNSTLWSDSPPLSIYDYAIDILLSVLSISTIIIGFRINSTGDNKAFVARYSCISLPIAIKVTLLSFILVIPVFFLEISMQMVGELSPEELQGIEEFSDDMALDAIDNMQVGIATLIATAFVSIYALWRYISAFKIASGQKGI